MTVRGAAVRREIEGEHEGLFHELSGRDLDARAYMVYA